jgi:hypothetical protein
MLEIFDIFFDLLYRPIQSEIRCEFPVKSPIDSYNKTTLFSTVRCMGVLLLLLLFFKTSLENELHFVIENHQVSCSTRNFYRNRDSGRAKIDLP